MSDALRELLASFVVEVDKAGELAKGNAAVDALKQKLADLQAGFDKVKAPAAQAAKAVNDVFARAAQTARMNLQAATASQLGGRADNGGFGAVGAMGLGAKQVGPTRDTLNAGRAQMAAAEQAAAAYAQTLRGKLAGAVDAVRSGFAGAGGGGSKGPGLIESLATVRNGFLALGAGAAVAGLRRLVDGIGDIRESAQRLGVTTDAFQRLRVLAEQNGTSVEALGTAFRTLANSAVQPTKETAAAFAKLGISTKDASGQFKDTNALFFEVATALADVGNETERSALAQDLLGRGAQQLKPIFAGGRAEIEKQRRALASMNVISADTIAQADELSDSWKAIGPSLVAAAEPLLKLLIPGLTKLTEWLIKGITATGNWLKNTDLASVGITVLGAAVATKLLPGLRLMVGLGGGAVKTLLGMAGAAGKALWSFARLAIPLLLIEDFITFLRGGESEFGKLLDMLFGKGASTGVLKELAGFWDTIATSVKYLLQALGLRDMTAGDKEQADRAGKYTGGLLDLPGQLVEMNRSMGPRTLADAAAAERARNGSSVVVGDTNVTINNVPAGGARELVGQIRGELDARDRNATLAGVPQ